MELQTRCGLLHRGFPDIIPRLTQELIKLTLRNVSHKGTDVRLSTGTFARPDCWPRKSFDPRGWSWRIIFSYPAEGDHINVAELKAILAAMRWRVRSVQGHCCRCVHLSDSQVCIGVLTKGRSSSRQLQRVAHRINCLLLASSVQLALVFVRTDWNPADRPSRWRGTKL